MSLVYAKMKNGRCSLFLHLFSCPQKRWIVPLSLARRASFSSSNLLLRSSSTEPFFWGSSSSSSSSVSSGSKPVVYDMGPHFKPHTATRYKCEVISYNYCTYPVLYVFAFLQVYLSVFFHVRLCYCPSAFEELPHSEKNRRVIG